MQFIYVIKKVKVLTNSSSLYIKSLLLILEDGSQTNFFTFDFKVLSFLCLFFCALLGTLLMVYFKTLLFFIPPSSLLLSLLLKLMSIGFCSLGRFRLIPTNDLTKSVKSWSSSLSISFLILGGFINTLPLLMVFCLFFLEGSY